MKSIILILTLFFIMGCSKNNTLEDYDISIELLVFDAQGNDLLDSNFEGFVDVSKVKIYFEIDNKKILQFHENLDCQTNFCKRSDQGINFVFFVPNDSSTEEFPVTYIHWTETDIDTVTCQFERGDGFVLCQKVWYNGELMFPDKAIPGLPRAFKIIK
jgi:hypothetical protein